MREMPPVLTLRVEEIVETALSYCSWRRDAIAESSHCLKQEDWDAWLGAGGS